MEVESAGFKGRIYFKVASDPEDSHYKSYFEGMDETVHGTSSMNKVNKQVLTDLVEIITGRVVDPYEYTRLISFCLYLLIDHRR